MNKARHAGRALSNQVVTGTANDSALQLPLQLDAARWL